jgi:hypothetical protein
MSRNIWKSQHQSLDCKQADRKHKQYHYAKPIAIQHLNSLDDFCIDHGALLVSAGQDQQLHAVTLIGPE